MWVLFLCYNLILFKIRKFLCPFCFGSLFFVFSLILLSLFYFNSFLVSSFGLLGVVFSCSLYIYFFLFRVHFCSVLCFVFIYVSSLFSFRNRTSYSIGRPLLHLFVQLNSPNWLFCLSTCFFSTSFHVHVGAVHWREDSLFFGCLSWNEAV